MSLTSLFRTPPPHVAIDIGPRHIVAVAIAGGPGAPPQLMAVEVEPLPEGAVVPSLTATNLARPADVAAALSRIWDRLGQRPRRIALVVPDAVGKVSLVRFQETPAKSADLDELIKFQLKKTAPFGVEDSQISYVAGATTDQGQEFVVVQARRDIVSEYEQACASSGAGAGAVELATFGVSHCVRASAGSIPGDWLLIHATTDSTSLAIFRGDALVFFRHRGADGDGHLVEMAHQTAMYYQDRLGGRGFSRVIVGGTPAAALHAEGWREIQTRLGVAAEVVDPNRALTSFGQSPWSPGTLETAVPALGVALSLRTGT
jgi:Tfp pilus assembly PilM family ATPase